MEKENQTEENRGEERTRGGVALPFLLGERKSNRREKRGEHVKEVPSLFIRRKKIGQKKREERGGHVEELSYLFY